MLARIQPTVATTRCIGMGQLFTDFYSRLPKIIPKNDSNLANFYIAQQNFNLWQPLNFFWLLQHCGEGLIKSDLSPPPPQRQP